MERRLAAILAADVVGYSRLIRADEAGTYAKLKALRAELIDPQIVEHHGRIVKLMGDGMLVEFGSVVDAVQMAEQVQRAVIERNRDQPKSDRIEFRVGINLGDVIVDQDDIHGDGVNIAARLERLAEPGGICVSAAVYDQVRDRLKLKFEDMGEQQVRNIDRPVHVWRWAAGSEIGGTAADIAADFEPPPLPDKPSIAVLPFSNMSGDADQEYFSDGITEDVITQLSRTRWFFVIARNSTFAYKGRAIDVKVVARELGVRYVVAGSVRKAGTHLRITAQLIDAITGNHLWADRYDRELTDIFDVQDDITTNITASIEPHLLDAEATRSQGRSAVDLSAWDLFMRAHACYWRINKANSEAAIDLLQIAVEKYPDYGPAHSGLAFSLLFSGHMGWLDPNDIRNTATELALRAAELDDLDPWAHVALGYLAVVDRHTDRAVREFDTALELNPNLAAAFGWRGLAFAFGGMSEEAIGDLDLAVRLSPRDPQNAIFMSACGIAHYLARRYEDALSWTTRGIQMRPDFVAGYRIHCATLAQLGRIGDAQEVLARINILQPNVSARWLEATVPYACSEDMTHFLDGLRKAGLPD